MNNSQVEQLVKSLGLRYDEVTAAGVHVHGELSGLEGLDWLALEPEQGVEMSFHEESLVFYRMNFALKETYPGEQLYIGKLPSPFKSEMTQLEMRPILGDPLYSSGPLKMPQPIGQAGGWESFYINQELFSGVENVLQYTASNEMCGLVFSLLSER